MNYCCPVCGFEGLEEPPYDEYNEPSYEVCSCCGFEFGVDDDVETEEGKLLAISEAQKLFREKWMSEGCLVFSEYYPKEFQKDGKITKDQLEKQLKNLNVS